MPYIKQSERLDIDFCLSDIEECLNSTGELNYAITRLLLKYVERMGGPSYSVYNAANGTLGNVDKEFYRRYVAPYEDKKMLENGDL